MSKKLGYIILFLSICVFVAAIPTLVFAQNFATTIEAVPEIQNPFRPNSTPKPSPLPFTITPPKIDTSSDDRFLLKQFHQTVQQREKQFNLTRVNCISNIQSFRTQKWKELAAGKKNCKPKKIALPLSQRDASSAEQQIGADEQQAQDCLGKVKQSQQLALDQIAQMRDACMQTKRQVLGLMTTIPN